MPYTVCSHCNGELAGRLVLLSGRAFCCTRCARDWARGMLPPAEPHLHTRVD